MWGKDTNPVAQAALWKDRLLPLQEGQCPPDIMLVVSRSPYMYERDYYDTDVTLLMILTSICMAMAGEGEEGLVAPLLPLPLGSEEL